MAELFKTQSAAVTRAGEVMQQGGALVGIFEQLAGEVRLVPNFIPTNDPAQPTLRQLIIEVVESQGKLMFRNGYVPAEAITQALGISQDDPLIKTRSLGRTLKRLVDDGTLVRRGRKRGTQYALASKLPKLTRAVIEKPSPKKLKKKAIGRPKTPSSSVTAADLKAWRSKAGLTQHAAAKLLKIPVGTFWHYEHKRAMPASIVARFKKLKK